LSNLRDPTGQEYEIDRHVGLRMRTLRRNLNLGQQALGDALGITFQQIQKYENGRNRLPASKLWLAADFMRVSPDYFFDGLRRRIGTESADPAAVPRQP
jgi:transcriptional regulator with XRE-family HTH domain